MIERARGGYTVPADFHRRLTMPAVATTFTLSMPKENLIVCCKAEHNRCVYHGAGAAMADTKKKFRIGLVQMRTGKDVQENLAQADAFIREAAGRGALYIQTPENTLVMEADAPRLLEKIYPEEKTEGVAHFSRLARELAHLAAYRLASCQGREGPRRQPGIPFRAQRRCRMPVR